MILGKHAYICELSLSVKKPTAQTAHLVFADTKANAKKTKRAVLLPTHGQKN
ncbi:MAG: hypothetical protein RBT46_03995 [Weeksellaceae bacterium]|nr:hypothetical protein [Weeksellaceae bacterium]